MLITANIWIGTFNRQLPTGPQILPESNLRLVEKNWKTHLSQPASDYSSKS